MDNISFKTDEFVNFSFLFLAGFAFNKREYDTMLNTFDGQLEVVRNLRHQLLAYPSEITELQGATDLKQHHQILYGKVNELLKQLSSGEISDMSGLKNFLSTRFGVKTDGIDTDYKFYCSFFEDNQECIQKNLNAMRHIYSDNPIQMPNLPTDSHMPQTTGDYLTAMRRFFDVPTDKKPTVYLHPFPDDPHMSGWSTVDGPHQTFCTKRLESDDKYVDGTTMLSRRVVTPLHETAHWMFDNSPMMDEFKKLPEERSPAVQKFISVMEDKFKKNPETNYHNPSPLGAIHEALASSADVVMRSEEMMKDFDYKTAELYYGFKAGNDLARVVYPIFHEYIANGKSMSDGFFDRIVSDKNFQEKFCSLAQGNEHKKDSTLNQTLASVSQVNTIPNQNNVSPMRKRRQFSR